VHRLTPAFIAATPKKALWRPTGSLRVPRGDDAVLRPVERLEVAEDAKNEKGPENRPFQ
jgi:hypothetical protein